MPWAAAIAAVGTVAGASISASGAKSAAKTQANSATEATAAQRAMFDKQIELQAPFREAGLTAQDRLMYLMGLPPVGGRAPGGTSASSGQLVQQSDGSYAPAAPFAAASPALSAPAAIDRNAIRAELLPQFTKQATGQAAPVGGSGWSSGSGMGGENNADSYFAAPAQSSAIDEAGLNTAIEQRAQAMQQQQAQQAQQAQQSAQQQQEAISAQINSQGAPAAAGTPASTANLTTPGSLSTPFGATQFQGDAAPKIADFSLTDFNADPGYAFRQSEQEKALQRAASAGGLLGSGSYLKDAMSQSGGLASQEFGNAFGRFQTNRLNKLSDYKDAFNRFQISRSNVLNPLQSLMGAGQTATGQQAQAAQNFGTQAGSNIMGAGNAIAAGQVGSANAINSGISQGVGMYQQQNMLNRLFPQGGGGSSSYGSFGSSPMSSLLYSNGSLGD